MASLDSTRSHRREDRLDDVIVSSISRSSKVERKPLGEPLSKETVV